MALLGEFLLYRGIPKVMQGLWNTSYATVPRLAVWPRDSCTLESLATGMAAHIAQSSLQVGPSIGLLEIVA